jgi:hypothetical protein
MAALRPLVLAGGRMTQAPASALPVRVFDTAEEFAAADFSGGGVIVLKRWEPAVYLWSDGNLLPLGIPEELLALLYAGL